MYRYIALSWNPKDPKGSEEAQRLTRLINANLPAWERVVDASGLSVFEATHVDGAYRAYLLKQNQGVVLGKLFVNGVKEGGSEGNSAVENFDDAESRRIVKSQGRLLVEKYWGYYVAFVRAEDGRSRYVLRDPTGGIQCHVTSSAGVDVFLSDIEDCAALDLPTFNINWNHVVAFLKQFRLVTRATGFREVTQLYAGECLAVEDGGGSTRRSYSFYWHPADIYGKNRFESADEARRVLRSSVRYCVSEWASSYERVIHELSGGLDSSIVAACMSSADKRTEVLCFNFFTEMAEGDERSYARIAAERSGFELIETPMRISEHSLEGLFNRTRVSTPAMLGFLVKPELLLQRLLSERRAGAVFSGRGGDQLFQEARTELVAAEYAHVRGMRPELFRIANDTSHLTRKSIWSIWAAVFRYGFFGQTFDPYSPFETPPLLAEDAHDMLHTSEYVHPWVTDAFALPSSKTSQVFSLVDCQRFFGRPCLNGEVVLPLISQPIIESCLQIPTYVLAHRGTSRGLLREAFENDVPSRITGRRSKGGTTSYFVQLLAGNIAYLRELLLDGVLVREGILDRRELEKALSERELVRIGVLRPLTCAVMAETWLSTWADVRQRTAA